MNKTLQWGQVGVALLWQFCCFWAQKCYQMFTKT